MINDNRKFTYLNLNISEMVLLVMLCNFLLTLLYITSLYSRVQTKVDVDTCLDFLSLKPALMSTLVCTLLYDVLQHNSDNFRSKRTIKEALNKPRVNGMKISR